MAMYVMIEVECDHHGCDLRVSHRAQVREFKGDIPILEESLPDGWGADTVFGYGGPSERQYLCPRHKPSWQR